MTITTMMSTSTLYQQEVHTPAGPVQSVQHPRPQTRHDPWASRSGWRSQGFMATGNEGVQANPNDFMVTSGFTWPTWYTAPAESSLMTTSAGEKRDVSIL